MASKNQGKKRMTPKRAPRPAVVDHRHVMLNQSINAWFRPPRMMVRRVTRSYWKYP